MRGVELGVVIRVVLVLMDKGKGYEENSIPILFFVVDELEMRLTQLPQLFYNSIVALLIPNATFKM